MDEASELRLNDGSVPPSFIRMVPSVEFNEVAHQTAFEELRLLRGYVIAVHHPGSEGYSEIDHSVYDVLIERITNSCEAPVIFRDCQLMVPYGSNADEFHTSIRCPSDYKDGQGITDELVQQSSRVLVASINGRTDQAVIIGFLQNPYSLIDDPANGHYQFSSFNGIETTIDKEGQYLLQFTGKTIDDNNEVAQADTEVAGAYIFLDKNGSIRLDNDHGESIQIDNANKKITIEAREKDESITDNDWTVEVVNGNVSIKAKKNITLQADGKIYLGEGANENVVLGVQLMNALKELVDIVTQAPLTMPVANGTPANLNINIMGRLAQWKARYAQSATTSPILSKNKYAK